MLATTSKEGFFIRFFFLALFFLSSTTVFAMPTIYWVDAGKSAIYSHQDGETTTIVDKLSSPRAIAVARNKLFYSEDNLRLITLFDLDSNTKLSLSYTYDTAAFPSDITFNPQTSTLYWSQFRSLYSLSSPYTNARELVYESNRSFSKVAYNSESDRLFASMRKAYISEEGFELIESNFENLLTTSAHDIALDEYSSLLYWVTNQGQSCIMRSQLDGSDIEEFDCEGHEFLSEIVVDQDTGDVYWLDISKGTISRANNDGTGRSQIISGILYGRGLALSDGCPLDYNKSEPGLCGCGVSDSDYDSDSTPDCYDECPLDSAKVLSGVCGCGIADSDQDGDGTLDCNDACPNDVSKVIPAVCGCGSSELDSDEDATPDCIDECPFDSSKLTQGVCGCGSSELDSDEDATPDCIDECPFDSSKVTQGVCGCDRYEVEGGCSDFPEITNNHLISTPPTISTQGSKVKILFQDFYKSKRKEKVVYNVTLRKLKKDGRWRTITFRSRKKKALRKKMKKGTYSLSYRATLKRRGRIIAVTGDSPVSTFTIKR